MRELDRKPTEDPSCRRLAIIGRGRLGAALSTALDERGYRLVGPLGRGADAAGADAVLLCVPDTEISVASTAVQPGPLVGHCSGATSLAALAPHEAFSLHPLMTVTGARTTFAGAGAAIAGSTVRALDFARRLAEALEMRPFQLDDDDRAVYHAAASIASNFLVTLESAAERLAQMAGARREQLVPLVRATVENWSTLGPERALTGPVARGDAATVAAQREAVAERAPDLLPLFDAFIDATRALAGPQPAPAEHRSLALR